MHAFTGSKATGFVLASRHAMSQASCSNRATSDTLCCTRRGCVAQPAYYWFPWVAAGPASDCLAHTTHMPSESHKLTSSTASRKPPFTCVAHGEQCPS
jgi:hypothetical protein